jgi:hypothetical protein
MQPEFIALEVGCRLSNEMGALIAQFSEPEPPTG